MNIRSLWSKQTAISTEWLHKWNWILAGLHAVQGALILLISATKTTPIYTNYLAQDALATEAQGHQVLATASRYLFDANIPCLITSFFFILAIMHLVCATVYRKRYEADLQEGINKAYWIGFGLSASVMLLTVAVLAGVNTVSMLAMIAVLSFVPYLLGFAAEVYAQDAKKQHALLYWIGLAIGIVPLLVIGLFLCGAHLYGGTVAAVVYGAYAIAVVTFGYVVATVYLRHKKKGAWADYFYSAPIHMAAAALLATLLAWMIFAGVLRP